MRLQPDSPMVFFVGETGHPFEALVRDSLLDPTAATAEFQLLKWSDRLAAIPWAAATISEVDSSEDPRTGTIYWSFRLSYAWTVEVAAGVYLGSFRLTTGLGAIVIVPASAGIFATVEAPASGDDL